MCEWSYDSLQQTLKCAAAGEIGSTASGSSLQSKRGKHKRWSPPASNRRIPCPNYNILDNRAVGCLSRQLHTLSSKPLLSWREPPWQMLPKYTMSILRREKRLKNHQQSIQIAKLRWEIIVHSKNYSSSDESSLSLPWLFKIPPLTKNKNKHTITTSTTTTTHTEFKWRQHERSWNRKEHGESGQWRAISRRRKRRRTQRGWKMNRSWMTRQGERGCPYIGRLALRVRLEGETREHFNCSLQ
jgi:hypothetical protein